MSRIRTAGTGKKISVLVIEADEEKKRLVLVRQRVGERKTGCGEEEPIARCETGAIMEGTVETIRPYGAFVLLKWLKRTGTRFSDEQKRVENPGAVVKVGQKVTVKNPVYRKWQTKP